jgi:hypothetical protein
MPTLMKSFNDLNQEHLGQTRNFLFIPRTSWFEPVIRPKLPGSTRKKEFFQNQ